MSLDLVSSHRNKGNSNYDSNMKRVNFDTNNKSNKGNSININTKI